MDAISEDARAVLLAIRRAGRSPDGSAALVRDLRRQGLLWRLGDDQYSLTGTGHAALGGLS